MMNILAGIEVKRSKKAVIQKMLELELIHDKKDVKKRGKRSKAKSRSQVSRDSDSENENRKLVSDSEPSDSEMDKSEGASVEKAIKKISARTNADSDSDSSSKESDSESSSDSDSESDDTEKASAISGTKSETEKMTVSQSQTETSKKNLDLTDSPKQDPKEKNKRIVVDSDSESTANEMDANLVSSGVKSKTDEGTSTNMETSQKNAGPTTSSLESPKQYSKKKKRIAVNSDSEFSDNKMDSDSESISSPVKNATETSLPRKTEANQTTLEYDQESDSNDENNFYLKSKKKRAFIIDSDDE